MLLVMFVLWTKKISRTWITAAMLGTSFWYWKNYVYLFDKDVGVGCKYVAKVIFVDVDSDGVNTQK